MSGDLNTTNSESSNDVNPTKALLNFRRPGSPPAAGGNGGGEAGEGGDRAPDQVTNREFMDILFPDLATDEYAGAVSKRGDPKVGGWIGFDAKDVETRCPADANNYFNCATFRRTKDGQLRAQEAQAVAYRCFVLDDVGDKTPLDALPAIELTWMLETSSGNFQVGYRLTTPITDPAVVKAAQKNVFGAGFGDKAAGGVARWVRLPNGINGKPEHRDAHGQPFACRLVEWNPDVSYELADFVDLLVPAGREHSIDRDTIAAPTSLRAEDAHPGIPADVFLPAAVENPVIVALKGAGLYKREASPGLHEVCCPWHDEHTDPDDDRAYFFEPSAAYPMGGFKCHHSHGSKYRLGALLTHVDCDRSDLHNKPRIRIVEGELQAMVDAAQVVLADTGEFFQAGGIIVKVAVDKLTGAASLQPQTDADLTLALSSAANWERAEAKCEAVRWRRTNALPNCIRLLTQTQNYSYLPIITGIARQPMLLADGQLISLAGYDPVSRYYCTFDPAKFARPDPTEANAREALARLTYLLREFHFAAPRDLAATLAAIFTAVLRACLGRAPGFHVGAPSPGSGKSLLCDVIARFAGPGHPAKVSFSRTEDEATKVILAALLSAPAVLDFDDMTMDWRPFGAVNRLLTSPTMTDRILGASKMATVSTDTLVLGSGNNTGPTGDLVRRVVGINLDTRSESPATVYYDGDPLRDVEANREAFVADVLLIVEAWIAAGRPKADLSPIATYGGLWTDFCRQPLVWLGLDDPAEGLIEQLKNDPDSAALGRLLRAWHGQFGNKPQAVRVIIRDAEGDLQDAIEDLPFVEGGSINKSSFGQYLRRHAGRPVQGLKLEKGPSRERNDWKVVVIEGGSPAPVKPTPPPPSPPLPPSVGLRPRTIKDFD